MAKEALYISEERVGELIRVIRAGLNVVERQRGQQDVPERPKVRRETAAILKRWCAEEARYMRRAMKREYQP